MDYSYVGKIVLIRIGERNIPVFCFGATKKTSNFQCMRLRPKKVGDSQYTGGTIVVGDVGLKKTSVALIDRIEEFNSKDIIRIIGTVSQKAVDEAQEIAKVTSYNGKTLLIRHKNRTLPVYCIWENIITSTLTALQLRPYKKGEPLDGLIPVGSKVAMLYRVIKFSKKDIIKVLGAPPRSLHQRAQSNFANWENNKSRKDKPDFVHVRYINSQPFQGGSFTPK